MEQRLRGEIAVVFGGATHIGKSIVEIFAQNNAKVILIDINKEKSQELVEELKKNKLDVYFFNADITNEEKVEQLVKEIIEKFGKIDILVNNIRGEKYRDKKDLEHSLDEWLSQFKFILGGAYLTCKYVLPEMIKRKKGRIVNIASVSSKVIGDEPLTYHVSKAGLIQFTKYIANKYGKFNIRANCISPGFIVKKENLEKFNSENNKNYKKTAFLAHPLRKIGLAEDVSKTALFLCSEDSSFITGQNIVVDGGLLTNDPWNISNKVRLFFEEGKEND